MSQTDEAARLRECLEQYIEGLITYPEMAFQLAKYQVRVWDGWMADVMGKAAKPD